jgi:hypothetical protein
LYPNEIKIKTHASVMAMMKKADEKKLNDHEITYKGSTIFSAIPYFDITRMIRNDWMHMMADTVKTIYKLLLKKDSMALRPDSAPREFEKENTNRWMEDEEKEDDEMEGDGKEEIKKEKKKKKKKVRKADEKKHDKNKARGEKGGKKGTNKGKKKADDGEETETDEDEEKEEKKERKKKKNTKLPFQLSQEDINRLASIHSEVRLPKMHGDPNRLANVFIKNDYRRSHDDTSLGSDYGIFGIQTSSSLENNVVECISRLLIIIKYCRQTSFDVPMMREMEKFIIQTLTLSEMFLPTNFFGINLHLLIHAFRPEGGIFELGPAFVHQQFDQERRGGQISKLGTNMKNPIAGITKNILIREELEDILDFKRAKHMDYFADPVVITPSKPRKPQPVMDQKDRKKLATVINAFYTDIKIDVNEDIPGCHYDKMTINGRLFCTRASKIMTTRLQQFCTKQQAQK